MVLFSSACFNLCYFCTKVSLVVLPQDMERSFLGLDARNLSVGKGVMGFLYKCLLLMMSRSRQSHAYRDLDASLT